MSDQACDLSCNIVYPRDSCPLCGQWVAWCLTHRRPIAHDCPKKAVKRNWQADMDLCQRATPDPWQTEANGVFIAAARSGLPFWLGRARRLQEAGVEAADVLMSARLLLQSVPPESRAAQAAIEGQVVAAMKAEKALRSALAGDEMMLDTADDCGADDPHGRHDLLADMLAAAKGLWVSTPEAKRRTRDGADDDTD